MNIQQNLNAALATAAIGARMTEGFMAEQATRKAEAEQLAKINLKEKDLAKYSTMVDMSSDIINTQFVPGKNNKSGIIDYKKQLTGVTKRTSAETFVDAVQRKEKVLKELYDLDPSIERSNAINAHREFMATSPHYGPLKEQLDIIHTKEMQGEKGVLREKAERDAVAEASIRAEETRSSRTAFSNKKKVISEKENVEQYQDKYGF